MNRRDAVLAAIDAANAHDPNRETDGDRETPAAELYGQRMSLVLSEFDPAPSDALQIAVRGQHIERWKRPRADYPEGRTGYLQWRRDAAIFHARRVADIMTADVVSVPEDAGIREISKVMTERKVHRVLVERAGRPGVHIGIVGTFEILDMLAE